MKKIIILSCSLIILAFSYGCSASPSDANPAADTGSSAALEKTAAVAELTADEITGLIHMREEEKLARDVYSTMYKKWNLRVFNNIMQSEQSHMDALLVLLKRYSIPDPVGNNPIGKFTDTKLQDLYNKLVESGNASAAAAVKIGVDIENLDIADLQEQIDKVVKSADVKRVYSNLKNASYNHLAAFTSQLKRYEL